MREPAAFTEPRNHTPVWPGLRHASFTLALLLAACTRANPANLLVEPVEPPLTAQLLPDPDPLAEAEAILDEIELGEHHWISDEQVREIEAGGLDSTLLIAALREAAIRCRAHERVSSNPNLLGILLDVAAARGPVELVPTLMQLERCSHRGWKTSEAILTRAMAEVGTCSPPSERELELARASLADFLVIDRHDKRLLARPPTPAELDDLAYFYAGIADAADPIGAGAPRYSRDAAEPDPAGIELRALEFADLEQALAEGELDAAHDAAIRYLGSLGYPGPIDVSLEGDWRWGGAASSYVMRYLAQISEIRGELEVAADLYLHANPGGGACGTSVDYRRGDQLRGFMRTQERLGNCRSLVALRLLDWDDEYDPERSPSRAAIDYGPYRLVRDGWDLARMYRGALLTRNRGGDRDALAQVLRADAPASARLEREGTEHWEWRVRAVEGRIDTGGRDAIDELVALLPDADDSLRERVLDAIGRAARRHWAGPCESAPEGWGWGSRSNIWRRPITAFGRSCETQLDDQAARDLGDRLLPYTRQPGPVRWAAMRALGRLAIAEQGPMLRRWLARATKAMKPCDRLDVWTQACRDADEEKDAAEDALDSWASVHDPDDD